MMNNKKVMKMGAGRALKFFYKINIVVLTDILATLITLGIIHVYERQLSNIKKYFLDFLNKYLFELHFLNNLVFPHSSFSNLVSFHPRTTKQSAFCRGMWPSDTYEGKN